MRIGVLSFKNSGKVAAKEELRLAAAARGMGFKAKILRSDRFMLVYDKKTPWILYDGKPLPKFDVIITRPTTLADTELKTTIIKQLEMNGVNVFNGYESILRAKNKIKTMQILDNFGIPIPKTVVISRIDDLKSASKLVSGFPLILKTAHGSFGKGVNIIESMRALKSLITRDGIYLLQEFVKFSRGKDIRIFVVGGEVVGTMMREAKRGEFRSNIELGGVGKPVEISDEEAQIAIRSVQALGLLYGGVDLIRSKSGPAVLEVNACPGFKGLEETTGADIAGEIVKYAARLVERHR